LGPIDNNKVEDFLRIDEDPAEDFESFRERAMPGTCEWILRRIAFQEWIHLGSKSPQILWLTGLPAMGKSFISAFVVNHLQQNLTCEYFFFKAEHQSKRSIGQMLRSIAFQFSKSSGEYRRGLLEMSDMGALPFDRQKLKTIWETLFEAMMFRQRQPHPIFWVIDGLDEAEQPETLVRLLSKIPPTTNIRILIVSRTIRDLSPVFGTDIPVLHEEIAIDDTLGDIRLYTNKIISNRIGKRQDEICNMVLEKAHGSFLWVALALNPLKENWHTISDIESVLNDFPEGMESLYLGMIKKISQQAQRPRSIAQRILTWATCGFRPLEVTELENALSFEFGEFVSLKDTIKQLCENFVVIEKGRITLIHHTARHFLLNMTGDFPLKIDIRSGNEHIAKVCIDFLTNRSWRRILALAQEKAPSPAQSIRSAQSTVFDENPFLSYAVTMWAYHVSLATTHSKLINLVLDFLGQSCLVWINAVALLKDMRTLARAAQHLRLYVERRRRKITQESLISLVDSQNEDLKLWSKDLLRLVGRFANNLTQSPQSIYKYVIPFCPRNSILHRTYGYMNTLSVFGLSSDTWDDCLARLTMGTDECATILLCSGPFFITLIGSGTLIVWNAESCEEARRIAHGEWVEAVACSKNSNLVVTAGATTVKVLDISRGIEIYAFEKNCNRAVKALSFGGTDDELLIGYDDATVESVKSSSGDVNWSFLAEEVGDREQACPKIISFSPDATQVIIGYRGRPLLAFTLNAPHVPPQKCSCPEDEVYGIKNSESLRSATPDCVLWKPDAPVVLILYNFTNIVEWNIEEDTQREIAGVEAKDMAISDDGNLLLTADYNGILSVWTVPEYRLSYRLEHDANDVVRCLSFSPDRQRLYDVRGPLCNVWEPDALVRPDDLDRQEASNDQDTLHLEPVYAVGNTGRAQITALICDSENKFFCCGKESGAVVLYDIRNGDKIRKVYGHGSVASITALAWSQTERFIASADNCGRIIAKKLRKPSAQKPSWGVVPLLDIRLNEAVQQLLFSYSEEYLLISSSTCDWVWSLKDKVEICRAQHKKTGRKWTNHPHDPKLVVWVEPENAHIFNWSSLQEIRVRGQLSVSEGDEVVDPVAGALDHPSMHQGISTEPVDYVKSLVCMHNTKTVVEIFPNTGINETSTSRPRLALLDLTPTLAQTLHLHPIRELSGKLKRFIGSWKDQLVFLDHQYCFSTWDVTARGDFIRRHFFLPKDWLSPGMLDLCTINEQGTILCPKNGEVAIIRSGIKL
jgi:WD40 repeat protein